MKLALLIALCLCGTGCWKTIHEASAPGPRPAVAVVERGSPTPMRS